MGKVRLFDLRCLIICGYQNPPVKAPHFWFVLYFSDSLERAFGEDILELFVSYIETK